MTCSARWNDDDWKAPPLALAFVAAIATMPVAIGCETDRSAQSTEEPSRPPAKARAPTQTDTDSSDQKRADAGRDAVELRLTRHDIERLFSTLRDALAASDVAKKWKRANADGTRPLVTVAPFDNRVGGSISTPVSSLTSRFETFLVNDMPVGVANFRANAQLYRKRREKTDGPTETLVSFGRELGLDSILTGTLSSDRPLDPETRGITYTVTLRVLDVASGETAWKTSTTLQKGKRP